MDIDCAVTDCGLDLRIDGRDFPLIFPGDAWQAFADKSLFADNYAFLKALHLPHMLERWEPLHFRTALPLFKYPILAAIQNNIPFCADVDGADTADILRRFMNLEFHFNGQPCRFPTGRPALAEKAVLNMSFGKDSLLTYAVAREIGLPLVLVMSVENDSPIEMRHKQDIARRFSEEFEEQIWLIENNTGVIHRYEYWGRPFTESGFGHLITEYFLNTLPFAFRHGARYILLGNEKSCDDSYVGRDGYRCFPVFDQTSSWLLEMSKMATVMAGDRMHVMSLIEPLHDIAITRILHTRYPEIGRYQLSCFPDENEFGRNNPWCGHCSKCARVYAHMKANGLDPRRVGLGAPMYEEEFRNLFTVFGDQYTVGKTMGYDASGCGRDEQLFALHLALERGETGPLLDHFRETHAGEARERRDELHSRFMSVHGSRSLPPPYAERVRAIYTEALAA